MVSKKFRLVEHGSGFSVFKGNKRLRRTVTLSAAKRVIDTQRELDIKKAKAKLRNK